MKQITAYVEDALYDRAVKVKEITGIPSLSKLLIAMLEQYCSEVEKEEEKRKGLQLVERTVK